jgi:SOS-response transcriptional repressor LexA
MSRRYQRLKELWPVIEPMLEKGIPQKEIENELGLKGEQPIHDYLKRKRRKQRKLSSVPKKRGRKAAVTLQEYKYENKRLKMENELLRDFLHAAGKR